jgi:hypothetical protein
MGVDAGARSDAGRWILAGTEPWLAPAWSLAPVIAEEAGRMRTRSPPNRGARHSTD